LVTGLVFSFLLTTYWKHYVLWLINNFGVFLKYYAVFKKIVMGHIEYLVALRLRVESTTFPDTSLFGYSLESNPINFNILIFLKIYLLYSGVDMRLHFIYG